MSKKYPWYPANRPPPADPSLAANIALIGRVGKCLEAALHEVQKEDDAITAADGGDGIGVAVGHDYFEDGNKAPALDETVSGGEQRNCSAGKKKRKRADSNDSSLEKQSKSHDADDTTKYLSNTSESDTIRMDKSISKSIMEAYGKAVAATNFDPTSEQIIPSVATNSSKDNNHAIAPAAMLRGEIDHYNRIGDRWRIVLKNAVIKPRKTMIITNGMTGVSLRRRLVLDWGDEGEGGGIIKDSSQQVDDGGGKKKGARQGDDNDGDVEAYHFKGTVQILAYDDAI
jgi:hypothetical protein